MAGRKVEIHRREGQAYVPADAGFGYGTGIAAVPEGAACLYTWIERAAAYRLASWSLRYGSLEVIPTIGTMVVAGWDAAGRRGYVSSAQGVHAIEVDPLRGRAKIRRGLPRFPAALLRVPRSDEFIVGARDGKTCARVSFAGAARPRRLAIPTPSVVVEDGDDVLALSFRAGKGASLGAPSRTFALPRALDATVHGGAVWILTETETGGQLATWSRAAGAEARVDLGRPGSGFLGTTRAGLLVVRTDQTVAWVDTRANAVAGEVALPLPLTFAGCVTGDLVVLVSSGPGAALVVLAAGSEGEAELEAVRFPARGTSSTRRKPVTRTRARIAAPVTAAAVAPSWSNETFAGVKLTGSANGPARFQRCVFRDCNLGAPASQLLSVRGVVLDRCTFHGGHLYPSRIEDSRLEAAHFRHGPVFLRGIDFVRVVFQGRIKGTLVIEQCPPAMLARSGVDDWALDISGAEFTGLELRGIPARLVRRNPETQAVVRRDRLLDGRWQGLNLGVFRITLRDLIAGIVDGNATDKVLVAATLGPHADKQRAALAELRRAGIAETD